MSRKKLWARTPANTIAQVWTEQSGKLPKGYRPASKAEVKAMAPDEAKAAGGPMTTENTGTVAK